MISETPPARSRSASVNSENANITDEEPGIRDNYAHPTSLKVWKQKRDKEIEEQELAKAKRAQSATKGKTKSPRATKPTTPLEKSAKDSKAKQQPAPVPVEKPVVSKSFSRT